MTEAEQIVELRKALESLVKLHRDWDKGSAYVTVQFMRDNNAAIAAARGILAKTVPAAPAAAPAQGDAENASIAPSSSCSGTDQRPAGAEDEILPVLLRAKRYTDAAKMDMLNKASGYSDAAYEVAQQSRHWQEVMADCAAIDTAIASAREQSEGSAGANPSGHQEVAYG